MRYAYNDGGRRLAGFRGTTGDCATRSAAIVTGKPYLEVYNALNGLGKLEKPSKRRRRKSNARLGVYRCTVDKYLTSLGFKWTPTMFIGQGCKVHLKESELPKGKLFVRLSRHYTAVIDGVIYDTYDCSRGETRCVYGYYEVKNDI